MEQLKQLRKKAGFTQSKLADRINRSAITVFRWEKGERAPDVEELRLLAIALNCSISDLIGESQNPTPAPARKRGAGAGA